MTQVMSLVDEAAKPESIQYVAISILKKKDVILIFLKQNHF